MEVIVIILIVYMVLGFIGMSMAKKRGRSGVMWFVWWVFFWVFAILYYLIAWKSDDLVRQEKNEDMERLALLMKSK
jgi:cytochrome c oxidase assembly factor CtaG